jgi:hypothetical protein
MRPLLPVAVMLLCLACSSSAQGSQPTNNRLSTTVQELHEGQVVDSVPCLRDDLPAQHSHVHVAILLDGNAVTVPAGIGVGRPWGANSDGFIATGNCFAWIHTHDTTGVVHVFTQVGKSYTLGQLFSVWGQSLGTGNALGYRGPLTVLVNGRPIDGDPRLVPLANFVNIVLEFGRQPANPPPALYDFGTMSR